MKRIIFGTTDSIIADKNHPKLKFVNIHLFLLFPSGILLLVLKFINFLFYLTKLLHLIRNSRKEIFRTVNKIFETLFIPRVEITHFYIRVSELFKTPSLRLVATSLLRMRLLHCGVISTFENTNLCVFSQ